VSDPKGLIGSELGSYRLIEQIGAGGMGVVFRAHDNRLDRDVAIKLLPDSSFGDPAARARLLREARTASRLNHPHICTVYEVAEAVPLAEGRPASGPAALFIAMELVLGATLAARLARGALAPAEVARIGLQLADALGHAHAQGVVHRDLKSANIMLTPEGRAKVLDFGLAKRVRGTEEGEAATSATPTATMPGTLTGTLAYMSPEQLRGQAADSRSAVWALGVVLHEMASGALPFQGQTGYAVSSAILNDPPAPLPAAVPDGLRAVIRRCLSKDPAGRYADGGAVQAALESLPADSGGRPTDRRPGRVSRLILVLSVFGLAALTVAALAMFGSTAGSLWPKPATVAGTPVMTGPVRLAVLPFANLTGDSAQEYFSDGFTEELITRLGRLRPERLSVIGRASAMRYKKAGTRVDQVGRELDVSHVLEGSVRREAGLVRITARLVRVHDETEQWGASYERDVASILAVQHEVTEGVARALAVTLVPGDPARVSKARAVLPQAYEHYQLGRFRFAERTVPSLKAALDHFERAVALDPGFALAYAGLADVQVLLPFFSADESPARGRARAEAAANRALALDPSLGEAHATLALVRMYGFDWDGSDAQFRRALDLVPGYASAHQWYADMLARRARYEEALAQIRQALALDPLSSIINQDLGYVLMLAGQQDAAIRQYKRTVELDPSFSTTWMVLAIATLDAGRFEDAASALSRWAEVSGQDPAVIRRIADAAATYARTGKPQRLPAGVDMAAAIPPYAHAHIYMALGQKDLALAILVRAFEQGTFSVLASALHPAFDPLRGDRRFRALIDRTGLVARRPRG
jgi:serine/threonine protein kinase/TolB-like protein/tetratricopeptide (TPR) repeat protein